MSVMKALLDNEGTGEAAGVLAEVRAAGTITRYRRAGSGAPVLLLCDVADARFDALFDAIAGSHRVIAPVHGESADEACTAVDCLAAFIEGLGLASVPVVAAGRSAGPAAALARLHPGRVDRLVLLGLDVGEPEQHVAAALRALRGD